MTATTEPPYTEAELAGAFALKLAIASIGGDSTQLRTTITQMASTTTDQQGKDAFKAAKTDLQPGEKRWLNQQVQELRESYD